jgi:hypothetical protein
VASGSGGLAAPLQGSFGCSAWASEADGLGQRGALCGVARGSHRVVGGQAIAVTIAARIEPMAT